MILERQSLSEQEISMIQRSLGPVSFTILGLGDIEIKYGSAKIKNGKCVWRKDKHRISFVSDGHGGFVGSVSKEPDPECQ